MLAETGESVILDASWSDERQRALTRQLADHVAADIVELHVDAPFPVAAARIDARRTAGDDPSDATREVAAELARRFHPWPQATRIDTTRPIATCVDHARDLVIEASGTGTGTTREAGT
jgi:predicted kinase